MSSVDNRVVNMQFNNRDFMSKIADTMVSLQQLERALKFGGNSFSDMQTSVNGVDFSNMASGIDSIKNRFSTLGIIGMTAIQNLTNGVMGFAKTLGSKVISGGISRAMNIEQAKFMIDGLGKSWDKLYKDMDYAVDQTAYGIDSAAKAAAQFSASGIEAGEDMKTALRGISGVAAMTGSSYDDIANVFTKVAGQGRLMGDDLLSMSSRGMNAAADLAKAMGKTETEIRDMVSKGKISFEEFAKVMDEKYGEHAKEANKTFTGSLSNVNAALSRLGEGFVSPLIKTNEMNDEIYNLVDVLNTFREVINSVKQVATDVGVYDFYAEKVQSVSKAVTLFLDLLSGKISGDTGDALQAKLDRLREALGMTETDFNNLKDTFNGIFSVFKIVGDLASNLFKAIFPLGDAAKSTGSGFLAITGAIGRYITSLEKAIENSKLFETIFSGLRKVIELVSKGISFLGDKIRDVFSGFGGGNFSLLESFGNIFSSLSEKLKPLSGIIEKVFGKLKSIIDSVASSLKNAFAKGGGFDSLLSLINLGVSGGIGVELITFLNNFNKTVQSMANGFSKGLHVNVGGLEKLFSSLQFSLGEFEKNIKANTLLQIAKAIGILAASLFVLSLIDPGKLATGLGALQVLLYDMTKIVATLNTMSKGFKGASDLAFIGAALLQVSASLVIMAIAVKMLSSLSLEGIVKGLAGVGILLLELDLFMNKASGLKGGRVRKAAKALMTMSVGLLILSFAMKQFASLNAEELAKGLIGIGVVLAELAAFMYLTQGLKVKTTKAAGLLALAASLSIIADAVKKIGKLKPEQLAKGLVGLGFVLLELAAFIKLMKGSKGILSVSVGMLVLAEAMSRMTESLSKLGNFSEEQLAKGLIGLGGSLVIIAGAMRMMPSNMVVVSAGLFIAAEAIKGIAEAMASMGGMSAEGMAKSLVEMAGALAILAVAMNAMNASLSGAAAMLVAAAALSVLAPVLLTLGNMSLEAIAKSLLAIAGAFVILGVAGSVLGPLVPAIMGLSVAIALFGVGLLSAGVGITMFVSALVLLATNFNALVQAIPKFVAALAASAQSIGMVGGAIVLALFTAIKDNIGKFVSAGIEIVLGFINGVSSKIGDIVNAGLNLAVNFINGIADGIDQHGAELQAAIGHLVGSIVKFVLEGLASIADAFGATGKFIGDKIRNLEEGVDNVFGDGTISKNAKKEMDATAKSVDTSTKKADSSAKKNLKGVKNSVSKSAKESASAAKGYNSIEKAVDKTMKGTVKKFDISKTLGPIADKSGKSYTNKLTKVDSKGAGETIGNKAASGAGSQSIYNLFSSGGGFTGNGYVLGVRGKIGEAWQAGYDLGMASKKGQKAATGEGSPAKEFIKGGGFSGEGYIIGLKKFIGKAYDSGRSLGETSVKGLKSGLQSLNNAVNSSVDNTPTIRPVLDLSNVKTGLNSINHMFGDNRYALGIAGSMNMGAYGRAAAFSQEARNVTFNNNITVDGAEDPAKWADEFAHELEIQARTR